MDLLASTHGDTVHGGRVLFTGNGDRVINDLIAHLPTHFITSKCPPLEHDLHRTLAEFAPHAVVICLQGETREMLRMYAVLEQDPKYSGMLVMAIGRDEDCDLFRRRIVVRDMVVLPRPVDNVRFLRALEHGTSSAMQLEAERAEHARRKAALAEPPPIPAPTVTAAPAQVSARSPHDRASILVVDDDILMLNTIKAFLDDLYEVTLVPSGKLALKFLAKRHADLVLLDYMMPEMDGPAVLAEIRSNMPQPDVPVLFLTGVSDKDMVMHCLSLRPSGYLLKPTTREALVERVTELLLDL